MPSYKLIYFDIRGRAEVARLLFAEAGQEYEDKRLKFDDWSEIKKKMPFGQVPVLMIDDKALPQSGAIIRYLARRFQLEGATAEETAFADMIMTSMNEVMEKLPFKEKDEEKKKRLMKESYEQQLCPVFAKLEEKFAKSKNEFLVGKQLTYADIALMNAMTTLEDFFPGFCAKFPNLYGLVKRTMERPKIKAWIAKRPNTKY